MGCHGVPAHRVVPSSRRPQMQWQHGAKWGKRGHEGSKVPAGPEGTGAVVSVRVDMAREAERGRARWNSHCWWRGRQDMGRDGGTATRLDGTVGGRGERGLEVVSHTRTSPSSKTVGEEVCFRRWGAPPPAPPAHSSASCPPEAVLLTPLPTPTSRQAPAQLQPSGHSPGPSPRPHPCELCSGAPDTVAAPAHTAAPATCR